MRKYSWLLIAIVVVAWVIITRRPAPDMPLPSNAQSVGQGIRIPVTLTLPDASGEFWGLSKKADKTYMVTVYSNKHIDRQFAATKLVKQDASGTTYDTTGSIQLDGTPYRAELIVVNTDGQSGYIELLKTTGGANTSTGS